MNEAEAIFAVLRVWSIIGAVVAVIFLSVGMDRIDEDAQGAYVFRPLLVPGILLIWPLVLWRWWALETARDQWPRRYLPPRRVHGIVAAAMAVAIIVTLATGWAQRQVWPAGFEPVKLSEAEK